MLIACNPVVVPFIDISYPIPTQAFPSISQTSLAALPEVPELAEAKHVLAGLRRVRGHCSPASMLHVEKCALVPEKTQGRGRRHPGPLAFPRGVVQGTSRLGLCLCSPLPTSVIQSPLLPEPGVMLRLPSPLVFLLVGSVVLHLRG